VCFEVSIWNQQASAYKANAPAYTPIGVKQVTVTVVSIIAITFTPVTVTDVDLALVTFMCNCYFCIFYSYICSGSLYSW